MHDDPRPGFNALRDKMAAHVRINVTIDLGAKLQSLSHGLANCAFEALYRPASAGGKTFGQIAHEAGERAGHWARKWSDLGESQRAEWEEIGAAVARAALAAPKAEAPEFTDTARAALLWVLWHHQGASSKIGQAMRFALGMGAHDRLDEHQASEAKRWAALAPTSPAPQEESK